MRTMDSARHGACEQSQLQKFMFDGLPVRGVAVRLSGAWRELVLRRARSARPYADGVCAMLGQMSAAALLMHANLKFDGTLLIQIMADGTAQAAGPDRSPVKLMAAEARADKGFRATAKVVGSVEGEPTLGQLIYATGKARCAITLDMRETQPHAQPYQGIVSLVDDAGKPYAQLAQALEHYMRHSEQLDTKMVLAASAEVAAGLLLQRMPGLETKTPEEKLGENEDFNRLGLLVHTLTDQELLGLPIDEVLHRLFWDEPLVRLGDGGEAPRFSCTCSRERVMRTIRGLVLAEAAVQQQSDSSGMEVSCEFCGAVYHFDAQQVVQISESAV